MFTLALVLMAGFSLAQQLPMLGDITIVGGSTLQETFEAVTREMTRQFGSDATVGTVFSSWFTRLIGDVLFNERVEAELELDQGRKTQLLAVLISAISARGAGYFGLSEVAGVSGVKGALLAVLYAQLVWLSRSVHTRYIDGHRRVRRSWSCRVGYNFGRFDTCR